MLSQVTKKLIENGTEIFDDALDLATNRLARLMNLPLRDAVRETIKLVITIHTVSPRLQKLFIRRIWHEVKIGKVRSVQQYVIELVLKNIQARHERVRPKNIEVAVFIMVHAVEAAIHAAVVERPDLLKSEEFVNELTDMVLRYLLNE